MRRRWLEVGLVVAGYAAAVVVANAVVGMHVAATSGPDRQGAGGMYAFGDSILFLAVCVAAGAPATAAAFYFLRPYRPFWRFLSFASLGIAATGLGALVAYMAFRSTNVGSALNTLSMLSPLRIIAAPLLGLVFLLAGLFAPDRPSRIALLAATGVEAAVFAYMALVWIRPLHFH